MVRGSDGLFSASSPSDPGIPTPSASAPGPAACTWMGSRDTQHRTLCVGTPLWTLPSSSR